MAGAYGEIGFYQMLFVVGGDQRNTFRVVSCAVEDLSMRTGSEITPTRRVVAFPNDAILVDVRGREPANDASESVPVLAAGVLTQSGRAST